MREATYALNGITLGQSPYIITDPPKGFPSGPPIRTRTTPRPLQHGAYGDIGYADAAPLELSGRIIGATSWATLETLRSALVEACWTGTLAALTITGESVSRQMLIRSVGSSPTEVIEGNSYTDCTWRTQWQALDPRMYDTALSTTVVSTPLTSGGWTFPWTFDWTFGGGSAGGTVFATNTGSAPAPWVARFDGPLVNPSITHQELGLTLLFNITLAAGDFLVVDSNAHTVLLAGTASRYSTLAQPNWFDLSPLTSNTIRFNAASGAGTMTFSYRNAWW